VGSDFGLIVEFWGCTDGRSKEREAQIWLGLHFGEVMVEWLRWLMDFEIGNGRKPAMVWYW
jgi:hypothetical protein